MISLTRLTIFPLMIVWLGLTCCQMIQAQTEGDPKGRELLLNQAEALKPIVKTRLGKSFLKSVRYLPEIESRVVLMDRENSRKVVSKSEAKLMSDDALAAYEPKTYDEHFYYFTGYGSPLAFVRPLEIVGSVGVESFEGKRVIDFGFGSIGQLRMLASQGADVTGIEVDQRLKAIYSEPSDVGVISNQWDGETKERNGQLQLLFGSFPTQVNDAVKGDADLFISKNTLKRGYIHPTREVDPRRLIHLGCTDATFLKNVHQRLKPGAYFMIYNLHPAPSADDEPYKPWADGRSPFDRIAFEQAGFEIIAFDVNDTAHLMAKALHWNDLMDLEKDLFATYTLVKKSDSKQSKTGH